jgi:hypothetical protein
MTEIKCPDCGSPDIKQVAILSSSSMGWSFHTAYSHLMQCRDCKTIFELYEDYETGDLMPYEPTSN